MKLRLPIQILVFSAFDCSVGGFRSVEIKLLGCVCAQSLSEGRGMAVSTSK